MKELSKLLRICKKYNLEYVDLSKYKISIDALSKLPKDLCIKHNILPIDINGDTLILAVADPENIIAVDDVRLVTQMKVKQVVATLDQIALYLR